MSEEPLPTVSGASDSTGSSGSREPDGPPAPVELESSSVRLVGTLAVAGALAGLAIVLVFQWANPRIEAWRAEVLSAAVTEVLAGADRYETVFLDEDGAALDAAADTADLDRVYVGYDRNGAPIGVAMVGDGAGFQDVIRVIFGYDPGSGEILGMQVLESKETPGLGDKIVRDSSFVAEFEGVVAPLVGLKSGRETGADGEVVMITGATISSRAVIDLINARVAEVRDRVDALWTTTVAGPATGPEGSVRVSEGRDRSADRRAPGGAP